MVSEIASAPPITYHSAPCLQLHLQSARSSCKTLRQNSIGCNERVTKTRARSDIRTDAYVSLPEGHEGQRGSHSACLPAPWMSSLVSCLRMCMCAFARPFTHTYTIHIYVYEIQYNSINRVAINIIALLRELILISANRNDNQNSKDNDSNIDDYQAKTLTKWCALPIVSVSFKAFHPIITLSFICFLSFFFFFSSYSFTCHCQLYNHFPQRKF